MDEAKKKTEDIVEELAKALKETGGQTVTMENFKKASAATMEKAEMLKSKAGETMSKFSKSSKTAMEEASSSVKMAAEGITIAALDYGEGMGKLFKEKGGEMSAAAKEKLKMAAEGVTIAALDKGEELGKLIKEKSATTAVKTQELSKVLLEKSKDVALVALERGTEAGKAMKDKAADALVVIIDKCDAGKSIMKASNEKFQEACKVVCDKRGKSYGADAKETCEETCMSINKMRNEVMKMAGDVKGKTN